VPLLIPAGYDGLDARDGFEDMGATPDAYLIQEEVANNEFAATPSPYPCFPSAGPAGCQVFKYTDMLELYCNTLAESNAYTWAIANDEAAFTHTYRNLVAGPHRYGFSNSLGCGNPTTAYYMNPGDSRYNAYLYRNDWSNGGQRYFPRPPAIPQIGVYEDDTKQDGPFVVGNFSMVSTEYGSGISPSGFATHVGDSPYNAGIDYETALAHFSNGACRAVCLPVAYNDAGPCCGDILGCSDISNGHCHDQYYADFIDDQFNYANLCTSLTGTNFRYLEFENPVLHKNLKIADALTLIGLINSFAGFQAHVSDGCAKSKLVDFEYGYGTGGIGDIRGGIAVRSLALALRWLVPNPATGMPDRVIAKYGRIGLTTTETPYYFEETFVPYGPEEPVVPFTWNGATQTVGGGCDGVSGDKGGAVGLLVQCVGTSGIYCQQYRLLYINGINYGRSAACVNTSTRTENVTSSWFVHDPISTYHYRLALTGGELTRVPYKNITGGAILMPCTNSTYCTGSTSLSAQISAFARSGADTLCGRCGLILLQTGRPSAPAGPDS
jgi:hypothetical protein